MADLGYFFKSPSFIVFFVKKIILLLEQQLWKGCKMTKENLWKNYTDEQKEVIFEFAEKYKKYLDSSKTER